MKVKVFYILFLISSVIQAQLVIDETMTPEELVQNVLVDPASVTPTNITLAGGASDAVRLNASRFYTNFNPTNLGLDQGVILATGRTTVAIGPNDSANETLNAPDTAPGDADLQMISSFPIVSATVLEFDFVATGEELNFDFVFASEEYPEYVGDTYNDSFGFFISGPGISGPFSNNAQNIALIPGTTTGISISTVNNGNSNNGPCMNCEYYVNNGTGGTPMVNNTIQYDGFTTVLKAIAPLQCGETYHIKLAIANVSDNAFDSAVFLKNFRIAPLELVDNLNLSENTNVCFGETVTINSNLTMGTNTFVWARDGVPLPESGTSISVTEGGLYSLTVLTSYGCQIAYDDILIGYLPEIATVNPPEINICSPTPEPYIIPSIDQTSVLLDGLNPNDYEVTYYDSTYDDAFFGTSNGIIPNGSLSNYSVGNGTTTIWVRVQELFLGSSGCVTVNSFDINASQAPSGSFTYPSDTYCTTITTPQQVTSTVTPGGTYSATPNGLSIDPNTGEVIPSLSLVGTYSIVYNVLATDACPAFSTDPPIEITIIESPDAPIVSSPINYCQNETASTLTANGTDLLWYTTSTGGSGSNTAPTPVTTTPGSTSYFVSQSIGGCESPRAEISVNIIDQPSPPTVISPIEYCQDSSSTILSANGSNLLWYNSPTGGTGNSTAPTPDTSASGTTNYYVSQTVNGCESLRAMITVNTEPSPSIPTVTGLLEYCQNETASPLIANGNNLLWYTASSGGTGSENAPIPNTSNVGSTSFFVSQTINGCEGPRAEIVVTVFQAPTQPTVTSSITLCQNDTATPLVANGTNLLWYNSATGGTGTAIAPTPDTSSLGITNYYVSQSNGGCEGPRAEISVTITPIPAAPEVTENVAYCQGEVTSSLTAIGTDLLWYLSATGGIGSTTAPTPDTASIGSTSYYVSQTMNGCESSRALINVTVTAIPPIPTITSPVEYCQNSTAIPLTASGTNLLWYTSATGGTGSSTPPVPSTQFIGATSYYVSQSNAGCEGPRAEILVAVVSSPDPPVVTSPITYCQFETASTLTATGSDLLWYDNATGGSGNPLAPIPDTSTSGSSIYYVSQSRGGCEGPRSSITVIVSPEPAIVLPQNGILCLDSVTNTFIDTYTIETGLELSSFSFEWYIFNDNVWDVLIGENNNELIVSTPGDYGLIVTDVTSNCESSLISTTVGVSVPPLSIEVSTTGYFENPSQVSISVLPIGNYEYQIDNGFFQTDNTFVNVSSGTHTITVRDLNGCGEITDEFFLINYPKFFTPNEDGYHDTWNVSDLNNQPNSKIHIFDRYGKLLKIIKPSGPGWDGSYNGNLLPSNDYWFVIYYQENNIDKEFRAHFALKR